MEAEGAGRLTRGLTILGAIAGLAGYVYVLGGALVWLRAREVHLPSDVVVAAVPRTDLLTIGLLFLWRGLLVVALMVVIAAVALALITVGRDWGRTVLLVLLGAGLVVVLVCWPETVLTVLGTIAAYVIAIGVLWFGWGIHPPFRRPRRSRLRAAPRSHAWAVGVTYGVVTVLGATAIAFAFNHDAGSKLHPVRVELLDGRCVAGLYLTRTADDVMIATRLKSRENGERLYRLLVLKGSIVADVRIATALVNAEKPGSPDDGGCRPSMVAVRGEDVHGGTGETGGTGGKGGTGGTGGAGGKGGKGGTGGAGGGGDIVLGLNLGFIGIPGPKGRPGPPGPPGPKGDRGPPGATCDAPAPGELPCTR